MSGANYVLDKGFVASTAVTQYYAVTSSSADNTCEAVDNVSDFPIGIVQETVTASAEIGKRVVGVRLLGISTAKAGASITRFARLKVTATGTLTPATTAADNCIGIAMESASSGDLFNVLLTPGVKF